MLSITACGRLVRDASIKFTANGSPVLGFSVACDVGFGDNKHPVYLGCSLWGKRAESLDPYLKKGTPVTIIGDADLRTWEQGEKHGAEITVNIKEVVMHGSKGDNPQSAPPPAQGFRKPPPPAPKLGEAKMDDFVDSDLPF